MTDEYRKFYIDGAWVEPAEPRLLDVIDPSTEEAYAQIAIGGEAVPCGYEQDHAHAQILCRDGAAHALFLYHRFGWQQLC